MADENTTDRHPAYGMVNLSRCTGRVDLFGSPFENSDFVALRVSTGERTRDLGQHWYMERERVLEVYLSAGQFAQLITTMNAGSGVPCTIHRARLEGPLTQLPPPPPEVHSEMRGAVEDLQRTVNQATDIDRILADVNAALEGIPRLPEKYKAAVRAAVAQHRSTLRSAAPFYAEQAARAAERIVASAAAEVDASVTRVLGRLGLAKLRELNVAGALGLPDASSNASPDHPPTEE